MSRVELPDNLAHLTCANHAVESGLDREVIGHACDSGSHDEVVVGHLLDLVRGELDQELGCRLVSSDDDNDTAEPAAFDDDQRAKFVGHGLRGLTGCPVRAAGRLSDRLGTARADVSCDLRQNLAAQRIRRAGSTATFDESNLAMASAIALSATSSLTRAEILPSAELQVQAALPRRSVPPTWRSQRPSRGVVVDIASSMEPSRPQSQLGRPLAATFSRTDRPALPSAFTS